MGEWDKPVDGHSAESWIQEPLPIDKPVTPKDVAEMLGKQSSRFILDNYETED